MDEIKIIPQEDMEQLYELRRNAYPSIALAMNETKEKTLEKLYQIQTDHPAPFYGFYRENQLYGSMRRYDFTMNLYGQKKLVGGLGSVAVDLLHKREKVAKKIVEDFIRTYREKGAGFVFLYPFQHDFYQKMGFGHGTRAFSYQVKPASFRKGSSKEHLRFFAREDTAELMVCYQRMVERQHGMIEKPEEYFKRIIEDENKQIVVYEEADQMKGYLVFSAEPVKRQNMLVSDLIIHEWVYENAAVLSEFMTFLHSQADQFEWVRLETQDENFYYLLDDPRNSSGIISDSLFHDSHVARLGMMCRVTDPVQAIRDLAGRVWGQESMAVQFRVIDSFLQKTSEVNVAFQAGQCALSTEPAEVQVTIDVANYSSLLYGSVSFVSLYHYGRVKVSDDAYVDRLVDVFTTMDKPMCTVMY